MSVTCIGEAIVDYRKRNGMKQSFLAEKMGVTRQSLHAWEHGVKRPSPESIVKIARAIDCSTDELLGIKET